METGERRNARVAGLPRVSRVDLLIVGLLIAIVATVYSVYALRVGSFQNDEEQYLQLARYVAREFPHALWQSGIYQRGTQRLDPIILAIPFALMRGPGAFQLAHVIQCLLFASTALPVFLLARRAGLPRAASLFAAVLSIVVPWAVVSTSFLAESLAYPAFAWVLYTTWSVLRSPSVTRELLAILALLLAALSRTALLALAPLLPLAVVWHEWGWELAGRPWRRRARELPGLLWSRYRLLTVAVALALLTYLADRLGLLPGRGLAALAGEYGVPHIEALSGLFARYREYLARMAAGTGFLAPALALAWTVAALVRPRDGARHALAVVCALGVGTILLSLLKGASDERYILYGAAPISLTAAAALSDSVRRAPRPSWGAALGLLAGALAVVLLIDSVTWPGLVSPYDFFAFPADMFYSRVILGHAPHLPLLHLAPSRLLELGILAVTVIWILVVQRWIRAGRLAAILVGTGLIVVCSAQSLYAMRKFTVGAGEATGADAARRSWVDEHVPNGARVGRLAVSTGETHDYFAIWRATAFWNTSVRMDVYTDITDPLPIFLGDAQLRIAADPVSGLLTVHEPSGRAVPASMLRYLLVPRQGTNRFGVDGQVIAQDPYLPLTLMTPSQPARLAWSLSGTTAEAFMTPGQPAIATIYQGAFEGDSPHCATFALIAAPQFAGRWPYSVSIDGRTVRRGSIVSQETLVITVPLPRRTANGGLPTLTARVHGQVPYAGMVLSARFANFAVIPCPARSVAG